MPTYDYQCEECKVITEFCLRSVEEKDVFEPACPECGSEKMKYVFRPTPFVFAGSLLCGDGTCGIDD